MKSVIILFFCGLSTFASAQTNTQVQCYQCDTKTLFDPDKIAICEDGTFKPFERPLTSCFVTVHEADAARNPTHSCVAVITFDKDMKYKSTMRGCVLDSDLAGISPLLTKDGSVAYAPSAARPTDRVIAHACSKQVCNEKLLIRPWPRPTISPTKAAAPVKTDPVPINSDSRRQVHVTLFVGWLGIFGVFTSSLVM